MPILLCACLNILWKGLSQWNRNFGKSYDAWKFFNVILKSLFFFIMVKLSTGVAVLAP